MDGEGGGAARARAIGRAAEAFDQGAFRALLGRLVAIRSTSQDEALAAECRRYLAEGIAPWAERLGFVCAIHDNPVAGAGPILTARRDEGAALPTVLLYGHGDTVRGLDPQWSAGLEPWRVIERDGRWYGRGTADNKGQHAVCLAALEAVLAERGGRLGANVVLLVETSEERGSQGLRAFVAANRARLAADVLIASDGPRVAPGVPTIATGTRGSFHFDLVLRLRAGGVHSGHWGGLVADPAIRLAHALGCITDAEGRILVEDWLPPGRRVPDSVRAALAGCPVEGGEAVAEGWGEPGLTPAEKCFGWTSFIVLAMTSGQPENPVNAVAPEARAHCQIRYTVDADPARFVPALRARLDAAGFGDVAIENGAVRMAASRTDPAHPWVLWTKASMERSLGRAVQVVPNAGGGLPGDVFVDHLGVPLVWVPHSYTGCRQHGPDEHLLPALVREGLVAFAGIWWDLGEGAAPG